MLTTLILSCKREWWHVFAMVEASAVTLVRCTQRRHVDNKDVKTSGCNSSKLYTEETFCRQRCVSQNGYLIPYGYGRFFLLFIRSLLTVLSGIYVLSVVLTVLCALCALYALCAL